MTSSTPSIKKDSKTTETDIDTYYWDAVIDVPYSA
jgi:hypothetical protein